MAPKQFEMVGLKREIKKKSSHIVRGSLGLIDANSGDIWNTQRSF